MRKNIRYVFIFVMVVVLTVVCCYIKASVVERHDGKKSQAEKSVEKSEDDSDKVLENNDSTDVEQEQAVEKKAFLTFDDGPSKYTEEVLAILEQYDIPATFFIIGNQINEKTEPLIRQAVSQGCMIGVHTYCHKAEEIYNSAQSYYEDVMEAKKQIETITEEKVTLYRFPWGSKNCYVSPYREEIIELFANDGLEYEDWNVSGEDSVGNPAADTIISQIEKSYQIAKDPVILLHDSAVNQETIKALPTIIEMFQKDGYTFDTLDNRKEPCHFCFVR